VRRRRWPGEVELNCEFLGQYKDKDLYICPGDAVGPSVIVRYGAEDSNYHSEPYFAYDRPSEDLLRSMEESLKYVPVVRQKEMRRKIAKARQERTHPMPLLPESREVVRRWERKHGRPLTKQTKVRPNDPAAYQRWKRQLREEG